jgi:hypothetical protein
MLTRRSLLCWKGHNVGKAMLTRKGSVALEDLMWEAILTEGRGLLRWRTHCGKAMLTRRGRVCCVRRTTSVGESILTRREGVCICVGRTQCGRLC